MNRREINLNTSEYERGYFRFTRSIENPTPIEEYHHLVGKYSHLSQKQIGEIKRILEERTKILRSFNLSR